MSARGLSKPALDRFDEAMTRYVERAYVPGLVALVSRDDDVHVAALGTKAVHGDDAMSRDTWWTYPDVGLIAILLTQRTAFPHTDPLHVEFATLARETVDD